MRFADIVPETFRAAIRGNADARVSGLTYDSRDVRLGYVFFAFRGMHSDGHDYIAAAAERGALAVVHDSDASIPDGMASLRVNDARTAMSGMAAAFYGYPSSKLIVVGVTGTEGKSSCVYFIYRLLELLGKKVGFFSTVSYKTSGETAPNPKHQTTPESITVQAHLSDMVAAGLNYAVVEASSHGLSEKTGRLADVLFDVGLVTNVRHEHLEFHGTWEQYRSDKANLVRALDTHAHTKTINGKPMLVPSFACMCADDPSRDYFESATKAPFYTYSAAREASIYASAVTCDENGSSFTVHADGKMYDARIAVPGAFNVENALAALSVVSKLSAADVGTIVPLLALLEPVHGRMTRIRENQPFEVLVDYAHTPSSFEAVLAPLRKQTAGRLICLFGSGGERDTQKRPEQGRIASRYCDIVFVTDEDPRGEDAMSILRDIALGCTAKTAGNDLFLIPDRREAIRKAVALASAGDTLILLGKSHEKTIDYADHSVPWNEIEEVRAALRQRGSHI